MYLQTSDEHECCGCGACEKVCPAHCIRMSLSADGFCYPVVDSKACLHCDECIRVCPFHHAGSTVGKSRPERCYYGWHKDAAVRAQSTSGGAFSAIAELILSESGGIVYGAAYDEEWRVCHRRVQRIDELAALRQSKYVQSDLGDCYVDIKTRASRRQPVLFCGTPCQVHGLRTFLGRDVESVVLLDFVCHGVTSPVLFKRYLNWLQDKKHSPLEAIRFRDKVTIGNVSSLAHTTFRFANSHVLSSPINIYLKAYMEGITQRECCVTCPYANELRVSDITIGDFWGLEDIVPAVRNEFYKGISLLLQNTAKGDAICRRLQSNMVLAETDVSHAFNGKNRQLMHPVHTSEGRQRFFRTFGRHDVRWILVRAVGLRKIVVWRVQWCMELLKAILPRSMYRMLRGLKGHSIVNE